jgi:hypothetical protein
VGLCKICKPWELEKSLGDVMEHALDAARDDARSSIIDSKVGAHAALGNILHKNKKFKED